MEKYDYEKREIAIYLSDLLDLLYENERGKIVSGQLQKGYTKYDLMKQEADYIAWNLQQLMNSQILGLIYNWNIEE